MPQGKTKIKEDHKMTYLEKLEAVKAAAPRHHISGGNLTCGYYYGENPFADTLIESALMCDMFPEEVPDPQNYFGFRRSEYSLSRAV